jgi:hypothetical protein
MAGAAEDPAAARRVFIAKGRFAGYAGGVAYWKSQIVSWPGSFRRAPVVTGVVSMEAGINRGICRYGPGDRESVVYIFVFASDLQPGLIIPGGSVQAVT